MQETLPTPLDRCTGVGLTISRLARPILVKSIYNQFNEKSVENGSNTCIVLGPKHHGPMTFMTFIGIQSE